MESICRFRSQAEQCRQAPRVNGYLRDISRDGSQLLSVMYDPKRKQDDVWTQPLSGGLPRLIVKDVSQNFANLERRRPQHYSLCATTVRNSTVPMRRERRWNGWPPALLSWSAHLSPDGTRIRFTDGSSFANALWEIGTNGRNLHHLLNGRKTVFGGSWSPDGKYYFFSGWAAESWSLWAVSEAHHWWRRTPRFPRQLTFGPMSIGTPAISNDGKQLYAVDLELRGELSVYDWQDRVISFPISEGFCRLRGLFARRPVDRVCNLS